MSDTNDTASPADCRPTLTSALATASPRPGSAWDASCPHHLRSISLGRVECTVCRRRGTIIDGLVNWDVAPGVPYLPVPDRAQQTAAGGSVEKPVYVDEDREIVCLIQALQGTPGGGDSVEITCADDDPATKDEQEQVICRGWWTHWKDTIFRGGTLLEALRKAAGARGGNHAQTR